MHSLFIVGKKTADWFNQQANAMGNDGLAISGMFLSKSGKEPGTHGWCGVQLGEEQVAAVEQLLKDNPKEAKDIDWTQYDLGKQPGWPQERLLDQGLKIIQARLP